MGHTRTGGAHLSRDALTSKARLGCGDCRPCDSNVSVRSFAFVEAAVEALEQYRDVAWLSATDLRNAVLDALITHPVTAYHGRLVLRATVDLLIKEGIGVLPEPIEGELHGYRQTIALLIGALLKINGANNAGIKAEVASRDAKRLEAVARALIARMSARPSNIIPEAPEEVRNQGTSSDGHRGESRPMHTAVPTPMVREPSPDAFAFRNPDFTPPAAEHLTPPPVAHPAEPAVEVGMWANVAVLDGVQLSIRGDVYGRLVATRRPEEILHAVRAALEAVTSGRVRQ